MKVAYVMEMGGLTGGHRLIFEHLTRLTQRGHWTKLFFVQNPHVDWFPGLKVSEIHVSGSYGQLVQDLSRFDGVKVATWWRTATPVAQSGGGLYYVQDIEHGYALHEGERQQIEQSYRLGLKTYTESAWVAEQLEMMGLPTTNVGVGINPDNFFPSTAPQVHSEVLFHDRSHHLKGPEVRSQVVLMAPQGIKFVGYSPWMPTMHLPNYEHFHSPTDAQLGERMRHALALLVTSHHEGFCLPAAEAMACGIPVVTTPADGNDFCIDGRNSLVASDPASLVNHITLLRNDHDLWLKLREGALDSAKKWRWEDVISRVENVLGAT